MTRAGRGLKLNAYDGGSAASCWPFADAKIRRIVFDSSRMPERPANQNLL